MQGRLLRPSLWNNYYVYTLAYPESMGGAVFYVGKGAVTPSSRLDRIDDHERKVKNGTWDCNERKREVIGQILDVGENVVKNKVAYFEQEKDAYMYEWALIFMTCWSDHLTNIKERPPIPTKRPIVELPKLTTPVCIQYKNGRPRTFHKVTDTLEFTREHSIKASTMRALLEGAPCSRWEIIQCACE